MSVATPATWKDITFTESSRVEKRLGHRQTKLLGQVFALFATLATLLRVGASCDKQLSFAKVVAPAPVPLLNSTTVCKEGFHIPDAGHRNIMLKRALTSSRTLFPPSVSCAPTTRPHARGLSSSSRLSTDGVYKALTEMRVRKPWIEAFRESQDKEKGSESPKQYPKPDTTPKTMADSYVSFVLPLAQDPWMLDTYSNVTGQLRTGAILMDLDALAGVVAYKHTGEGVSTVTAAVDRISIQNPLQEICDLELSGQVTFATGRSSMEVTLQVAKAPQHGRAVAPEDIFMTCAFTMVSLDPITKRPVNIAPLKLETQADRALFAQGERNYKNKRALKSSHILSKAPDAEESVEIHKMWTNSLAYADDKNSTQQPTNAISMAKSVMHSTSINQPQYRNRHHFMIFGGYLLKQTFELAFTCAAAFSHTRVQFLNLDPSTFEEPVPVGSVLYVSARVTYTEKDIKQGGTKIQVMVSTYVRNVEHAERKETGTFFYTFHTDADVKVLPQTYSDFMLWVSGQRRARRLNATMHDDIKDQQVLSGGVNSTATE